MRTIRSGGGMSRLKTGACLILLVVLISIFWVQVHVVQADRL